MTNRVRFKIVLDLLLIGIGIGYLPSARADITLAEDYSTQVNHVGQHEAVGPDLFGERIDFNSGSTEFVRTDIDLKGNNNLVVGYAVKIPMYDAKGTGWISGTAEEIPRLHGIFKLRQGWQADSTQLTNRCSAPQASPPSVPGDQQVGVWDSSEYWHGNSMYVPGAGDQALQGVRSWSNPKPSDGSTYYFVTRGGWYLSCLSATKNKLPFESVAGEGFLAIAPDGTKYYFDWIATNYDVTTLAKESALKASSTDRLQREEIWLLPTRIVDRFGNWVAYTYVHKHISSITTNDGRALTFNRDASDNLLTITDGSRTWTYDATGGVTYPDGSKWSISVVGSFTRTQIQYPNCSSVFGYTGGATATINHPSGAVGVFTFAPRTRGRSYMPNCTNGFGTEFAGPLKNMAEISIASKAISGPGLPTSTWNYVYGPPNGSYVDECTPSCLTTRYVEVTGPNSFTRFTFGNKFEDDEGKLLKREVGTSATSILSTEDYVWEIHPTNPPYPLYIGGGIGPQSGDDYLSIYTLPLKKKTTTRGGSTFVYEVLQFDSLARPLKIARYSNPGP